VTSFPIDWRLVVDEAIRRRKADGLTQRSLAALAGVSVPTINAFEQGDITLRFERIVAILEALGLFIQPDSADSIQAFVYDARKRWQDLTQDLPEDSTARQPDGHSEHAYSIEGIERPPTVSKLREILAQAPKTSGWTPFWAPSKESMKPAIRDGLVECWLGKPDFDRFPIDAAHSDFWQVSRAGSAYLQRGYQEDGSDFVASTIFDLTLPIWRTSEVFLHAAWLARELGGGSVTEIRFIGRYTGLAGRELLSWAKPQLRLALDERRRARSDSVDLETQTSVADIEERLDVVVSDALRPLYERFDGYVPPSDLFAQQTAELRRSLPPLH
jgi:transcriptional regulator with XRE-family HTH domain